MEKSSASNPPAIKTAITQVGGPKAAARICDVTERAVYKWLAAEALPRTEYTGETEYAAKLAAASDGQFTKEWLLRGAKPKKPAA